MKVVIKYSWIISCTNWWHCKQIYPALSKLSIQPILARPFVAEKILSSGGETILPTSQKAREYLPKLRYPW
jgi:hypothetical protein